MRASKDENSKSSGFWDTFFVAYITYFTYQGLNWSILCNQLQVAIPIVPTIRVLVTFTKFEELQPSDEFATPLSSPTHFQESKAKEAESSGSWYAWMRGSRGGQSSDGSEGRSWKDEIDPFHIPTDYTWVDANEKKRRTKAKKVKSKRGGSKKQTSRSLDGQQLTDGFEE